MSAGGREAAPVRAACLVPAESEEGTARLESEVVRTSACSLEAMAMVHHMSELVAVSNHTAALAVVQ